MRVLPNLNFVHEEVAHYYANPQFSRGTSQKRFIDCWFRWWKTPISVILFGISFAYGCWVSFCDVSGLLTAFLEVQVLRDRPGIFSGGRPVRDWQEIRRLLFVSSFLWTSQDVSHSFQGIKSITQPTQPSTAVVVVFVLVLGLRASFVL